MPDVPLDCVFVSPLSRAMETARLALPHEHWQQSISIEPRLIERDLGDFTLRNKSELQSELGIRDYDEALYGSGVPIDEAESFEQFYTRVSGFLRDTLIPMLKAGRRVMVVAHKYVIELLARLILDVPLKDGYDLRLPNARVMVGSDLRQYCRRESRRLNRLREWAVLHHEQLLAVSVLLGAAVACAGGRLVMHWSVGVCLLAAATLISVIRVDLSSASAKTSPSWLRVIARFVAVPGVLGCFVLLAELPAVWVCGALILAAPAATTSVTLSRCVGGVVVPAVSTICRSIFVGCLTLAVLYQLLVGQGVWSLALTLAGIAWATTLAPCAAARWLRRRTPIASATWAERQSYLAVVLLCVFVFVAAAQIDPAAFYPFGPIALALGVMIRIAARVCARDRSLFATDDYLAMAYPNIFLVIILAQMMGYTQLTQLATWFLIPMFLLSPIDARICRRLQSRSSANQLRRYLKISLVHADTDTGHAAQHVAPAA